VVTTYERPFTAGSRGHHHNMVVMGRCRGSVLFAHKDDEKAAIVGRKRQADEMPKAVSITPGE
jgi:hypothetical protein